MIYLGADHGGFALKEKIKVWLTEKKLDYQDLGALNLDPNDDYPQYAFLVAEKVSREDNPSLDWTLRAKGIIICRSAAGVVIAANKVKNIRAFSAFNVESVKLARSHNDANVIGLSADLIDENTNKEILESWLITQFSRESRHQRRIDQISKKEII